MKRSEIVGLVMKMDNFSLEEGELTCKKVLIFLFSLQSGKKNFVMWEKIA
ncbi:MAG: hypothetical protein LIP09_06195 [Bacteroidales bacterium]|nr:hypothetical protein [Bacteroidales bacterium]